MLMDAPTQLTPREATEMEFTKAENEAARQYNLEMKRLELEVERLQVKWGSLLRIPMTFIKLPVLVVMAVAYCICCARKVEPNDKFWNFLK